MIKKTLLEDKNIFIALFIYAFLLIFFCSKMSPLYPFNEWSDVNLYFNIGKAIAHGKVPYTEAFDHKGPLIFFIYSLGYLISNASFLGMYIIESLFWVLMIFTAYLTAKLYLKKGHAYLVALAFPVIIQSHTSQGGSAEEFIVIFETISLYLFILYFKNKEITTHKPAYMLVHGLLCAMTLFIKINLVIFWFFPLLAILVPLLINKEYKNLIHNIIAFTIGVLIIALPICIYFLINNAFGEAWNIYIILNKSYASVGTFIEVIELLIVRFYLRLRFETFEFLAILVGAFYFPFKYLSNKWGQIAIPLSFISLYLLIFVPTNYVFYYSIPYYVYALPACIIICKCLKVIPSTRISYAALTLLILVWGIKQKDFFEYQIADLVKGKEINTVSYQFSKHVKKEKSPTLLNLGLDSGNGIFTRANVNPTFKYFISPNIKHEAYPEMRDEQTRYIENKEPQFIILAEYSNNFQYFHNLPALNENYSIIDSYLEDGFKTYYLYKKKDNIR
ncbi:MAG: glycosyltransferase family 39 protein [Dysgonomonas sp.]|nr:glycosyltransferase family 39 protein [Dysgonomonas sp.]